MIQALEKLFIRPSRHHYRIVDLGPQRFKIGERWAFRKDTNVLNREQKKIQISLFLFDKLENTKQIIIYCHCNSGSKIEGASMAKNVLQMGISFLVFDFTGSGLSQGEYITLGLNQSQDLQSIVQYLKSVNPKIQIGLWGRSMGAVACLLYIQNNPNSVSVGVYDSPFSSLKQLAIDIGSGKTKIPKVILEGLVSLFNKRLILKTKDDLFQRLDLSKIVENISMPGLFLGSRNDSLIPFKHIQHLYSQYGGYKQIYYLEQDHHQKRIDESINYCLKFLHKRLKILRHKKSTSNLLFVKDKHQLSQIDFRYSFQNKKKLELSYMTSRKQKQKQVLQPTPKQQKKKFIHLTQVPKQNKIPKKIKLVKSTLRPNKKPNLKMVQQKVKPDINHL